MKSRKPSGFMGNSEAIRAPMENREIAKRKACPEIFREGPVRPFGEVSDQWELSYLYRKVINRKYILKA